MSTECADSLDYDDDPVRPLPRYQDIIHVTLEWFKDATDKPVLFARLEYKGDIERCRVEDLTAYYHKRTWSIENSELLENVRNVMLEEIEAAKKIICPNALIGWLDDVSE